uniref:Uncharacterized protein n=1 Tax=Panagrolaimus sp. ES5 TaxID=591445 RepID=A0AC34GLG4_9BILA
KSSGKYDLPPSQSCKASDSEIDSVKSFKLETPCAIEILMGRFVILESSYFSTIKRHCFEQELEASLPLLAAVERFMGISAGRNLFNSTTRMFYCTNEDMDTETMLEMNAKEHGILTMGQLASPRGNINLVIDYTGKLVKSKRQPFTISAVNAAAETTKKNHFVN